MKIQHGLFSAMAVMLLFSTASFAQQVKTDYDRGVNFSQYKTYSWGKIHTEDPLWVGRIKDAVDSALASKGWTQVQSGGSVTIMALEMNQTHKTLDTYYDGFGGGWGWGRRFGGFGDGFGESTTTEDTYQVGTLVIDLFDTNTKTLIWRGSASDTLSNKSEKNIKNLNKGVEKLFSGFPPEPKN